MARWWNEGCFLPLGISTALAQALILLMLLCADLANYTVSGGDSPLVTQWAILALQPEIDAGSLNALLMRSFRLIWWFCIRQVLKHAGIVSFFLSLFHRSTHNGTPYASWCCHPSTHPSRRVCHVSQMARQHLLRRRQPHRHCQDGVRLSSLLHPSLHSKGKLDAGHVWISALTPLCAQSYAPVS